jgi:hypothetical protein
MFQMGVVFNFDDVEKMQPSTEITFGGLDFIVNQLGNLHLQEGEPPMQEDEQPPSICLFLVGIENAMEAGPLVLAGHMNLHSREAFTEFSSEYLLDKICILFVDSCWVPDADPTPLLDFILTGFPTEIRNVAATYGSWLRQSIEAIPEPDHHATKGN